MYKRQILYELRGNVSDLRREVTTLRKQIDDNRALDSFAASRQMGALQSPDSSVEAATHHMLQRFHNPEQASFSPYQDIEAEEISDNDGMNIAEGDSLNLSDIGRQAVEKALERNGGNRKKAAQELGISDRTLYRRIKQYGLDK